MRTRSIIQILLAAVLLLAAADQVWAVKRIEAPENFGQEDWVANNYEQAVGYLKYIADKKVREELLAVPAGERLDAWDKFWKNRDPDSTTPENEAQQQYFARIAYANENLGSNMQEGWLTEMGEVYIRLGEPRMKERVTMRSSGKDLEIWNYWFPHDIYLVFLDRSGVGDFYLLNPSAMLDEVFFR